MEFTGLTSASLMSLPEAGYGSEEGHVGSEISGAVSGVTTPGASRLQASQLQERSTTMQRLHFFTSQQNLQMFLLLKNLVNSFFTNLLPLSLSHTELIKLSNIQLIPIIAYRLIYNSLPNKLLDTLDHSI